MEHFIIFLCGVLSGLVTLLLGYFIRMGLLHNQEIKNLKINIDSVLKELEDVKKDYYEELANLRRCMDDDFEGLQKKITELKTYTNNQVDESIKYTDRRIDKSLEKITELKIYTNNQIEESFKYTDKVMGKISTTTN